MGKRKRSGSWSKGDDYGAKRSDDCDSQEELEGDSTVAKSSSSSTINVRCSARVQEKQEKLRREASPSKLCPHDGICVISSGPSSSNSTVMCKVKNNNTNNNNSNPSDDVTLTGSVGDDPGAVGLGGNNEVGSGSDGKRKKRTWELWSQYDKQLFFEALNEFGKDFDAIQTHLASKLKSKNKTVEPTQIKKKEQVRHFYYRTWNKIQKYLHFPKDMKKAFQELYGLVNYGELRKKQRSLNGKTAAKLLELVEKGSTTIKVKGKTLRIKTPVCQALKKINNLTDVEPTKVPTKVVVELLPKDGSAWSVVQSLSHNPRVRTLVLLQRTLASIISYLEERWKSSQDRIKEQMMAAFGKNSARRLRLIPASRRDSTVPIFKAYETASSAKISLNSFSRNVLNKDSTSYVKLVEKRKRKKSGSVGGCGGGVEAATDSVAEVDWSDAEMGSETQLAPTYTSPGAGASSLTPGSSTLAGGASTPAVASSGSAGCSSGSLIGGSSGSLAGACSSSIAGGCSSSIAGGSYSSLATKLFRNAFGDDTLEVKGMAQEELQRMLQSIYDLPRLNNNNAQEDEDFENGDGDICPDSDDYQKLSGSCCCHPGENNVGEPEEVFSTRIEDEILKKGWTADEAGSLTVGEVYMLVGHDDKLSFEYEWVEGEEDNEANARTRIMLDRLISVARNLKKKKQSRHKLSSAGSCPSCGHNINNNIESAVSSFPPAPTLLPYRTPHSPGIIASKSSTSTPNNNNNNNSKTTPPPTNTVPVQSASSLSPSTTTVASIFEDTTTSIGILSTTSTSTSSTSIESETKVTTTTTKKITPTLVSPSCTGATMLTTLPTLLSNKPEEILQSSTTPQVVSTCSTTSKESKEDTTTTTFRVPNGTHSPLIYPRIRPMPSDPEDSSTSPSSSSVKNVNFKNAPKPFLDLPKGNRRLGRPCCKKNIVPRYLPLLPKKVVEPPPQPAVWEIVGNKAATAVHTVYVSSAAQLMLPISIKNPPTTSGNPPLVTEEVSSKVESHRDQPPEPSNPAECTGTNSTNNNAPDNNSPTGFNHLLKVPPDLEGDKTESNLSLSSFMDISLPESTRNVANECLKSEKFLDVTLGSSSCSLSLSNFLGQSGSSSENLESSSGERPTEQSLKTPQKVASGLELIYRTQSPPSNLLSTTENQWLTSDGNDLSLGSLLGNLESGQSGVASENEMNFQSMIEDSNNHLDFTSKFSELVAELESGSSNNNNKK